MYTSRNNAMMYNENYYTSRKKILNAFLADEESENMKYIEETESLVSQTKMFLKDLISGNVDFETLNDQLDDIQTELESDCNLIQSEINTLTVVDKNIENQTLEIQKQEEQATKEYKEKIEQLKSELEAKEFSIQNMERLYLELENVIKENMNQERDQLLTMEQFNDFISQNDKLKKEIKLLQIEKEKLTNDYNNLLKENLNLRSKDESFEVEKIKDALNEITILKGNIDSKSAESKIKSLQEKNKQLTKECNELADKISKLTINLKALNIDNAKFNEELNTIHDELINYNCNDIDEKKVIKMNRSQSFDIDNNREISIIDKLKNKMKMHDRDHGITNII